MKGDLEQRIAALRVVAFVVSLVPLAGCDLVLGGAFAPGTYTGDLACRIIVVDPSGAEAQDSFPSTMTLTIDEAGTLSVNGVELIVGNEVTRSIPTADLTFEITEVTRGLGRVGVSYEPRPTLPGITVEGELFEDYRWRAGLIRAFGHTDLIVTDVSGDAAFQIECSGTLTAE